MHEFIPAVDATIHGGADRPAELFGSWAPIPDLFRRHDAVLPGLWNDIFGPLRNGSRDGLMVVAQIGQSIDGRIATDGGQGEYINGPAGLDHLHRLRALMDAVVVGVGTAVADDPQLTVRRVAGPQPARVVIDPRGRLPQDARILAADGARRIVITGVECGCRYPDGVEVLDVALANGRAAPIEILRALQAAGIRRVLVEGGGQTVSSFLSAGCLDRLHIMVAPMLLGSGIPGLALPPIGRVDDALRPPVRTHMLGDEVLFDVDLSAQRIAIGSANTSR